MTRLVDALAGSGDLRAATARLVAVGHTSGTALAHGVLAATRQALARAARPGTRWREWPQLAPSRSATAPTTTRSP